jgi:formylmethanofuran dehydrogenase subunit A
VVVKDGDVVATPVGGTHFAEPGYDEKIESVIDRELGHQAGTFRRYTSIGRDELCTCGNFGRLLPASCHA